MSNSDKKRVAIVTRVMAVYATAVFFAGAICLVTGQFAQFM